MCRDIYPSILIRSLLQLSPPPFTSRYFSLLILPIFIITAAISTAANSTAKIFPLSKIALSTAFDFIILIRRLLATPNWP